MKVLELFAGTRSIGKAFERRGHEVASIDLNPEFTDCIQRDAYSFTLEEMNQYDVIWASPDCATYSVASGGLHRIGVEPMSDYAVKCDMNNKELINKLLKFNGLWFIENPHAALRKMQFMFGIPYKTVTYCQYGGQYRKITDIWSNHPDLQFKPICKRGDKCHCNVKGMPTLHGVDRARIPDELCDRIVELAEGYYDERGTL